MLPFLRHRILEGEKPRGARLGVPPSKPDPKRTADRAALAAVVDRAVGGKKK